MHFDFGERKEFDLKVGISPATPPPQCRGWELPWGAFFIITALYLRPFVEERTTFGVKAHSWAMHVSKFENSFHRLLSNMP